MLKKIALFSALAAMMGTAYAYKAEVGVSYSKYDTDGYNDGYYFNSGYDNKSFELDATYYLNPVDVKNYPLNEAAFLSRASNFNAQIGRVKNEISWGERGYWTYKDENKVTTFQLGLEYFVPNSKFYVNANIGQAKNEYSYKEYYDGDLDYVSSNKDTSSFYSAEVGYSPINGLLIAAGLAGYTEDYDDTVIDPTLRAKYVTTVGKFDANFEGNARFGEDTYYGFGADLYIDKTLSVGLAYSASDNSYDEDDAFSIRAKKFFTPQISVEARANISGDVDGYGLRAAYRF
ncbi:putative porin [Acinetobacter shaoyimingii]|uniref:Putative porin n=1 Tax=Acinetobacter shaoyimingii TaxID=2715164 RepID=A0A6G8RS32_9GAMM|nr:putative porin [Acinetobacter shaoyimingii]QIO04630.1 putative porin [Acinetobacter shaoyimingii]